MLRHAAALPKFDNVICAADLGLAWCSACQQSSAADEVAHLQEQARQSIEVIMRALQAASEASSASNGASSSAQLANLRSLDKQIEGKIAIVSKTVASGDTPPPAAVGASAEAVRLLKQKLDAEQRIGGLVRIVEVDMPAHLSFAFAKL